MVKGVVLNMDVLWGCIDKVGLILFDEENCVLYFDLLDFVCSFPLLYMPMYLLSLLECHELFCFPLSSLGLSSRWARRICSPKYCWSAEPAWPHQRCKKNRWMPHQTRARGIILISSALTIIPEWLHRPNNYCSIERIRQSGIYVDFRASHKMYPARARW
jgi:hypothetical protein